MIAYIYDNYTLQIENIINNVISIQEYEINGDSKMKFGGGSDYVILQNSIDKNIGEVIILDGLNDCKDFFLKGSNYWYQEQIKQHTEQNKTLESNMNFLTDTIVELSMNITI